MKLKPGKKELQRISLHSQGLAHSGRFGKGKYAVQAAIEHLGYVQIDTLSVVERAHHHTLWSRIPDYKPEYLDQLVAERRIFEYWSHAASYLPMKDFRFALPQMLQYKRGEAQFYNKAEPAVMKDVLDRVRAEGPLKTREFEAPNKSPGSWWNWKPTKIALEHLFMQGDLMISGRHGMEKIYDLTERVLPDTVNTALPSPLEQAEYLVMMHLRAYGHTTVKQITHLRPGKILRSNVEKVLLNLMESGIVSKVRNESAAPFFILHSYLEKPVKKPLKAIKLLSPFDNAVIHRDRVMQLFDFDFRLECYTPKEKRIYGYFCLPILFGDTFIGRMDCKAQRKLAQLEIFHLHIENLAVDIDLYAGFLVDSIRQFAIFNGCKSIKLTQISPSKYTEMFKKLLEE